MLPLMHQHAFRTPELVTVPGGTFLMGSPPGEGYADERPQRRVEVARFRLGKCPITQAEWTPVMGENRSRFKGDRLPVENVSHTQAVEFCRRLSELAGALYRLPTEAEWEYACRAGTKTPFAWGPTISTDQANYCGEHVYAAGLHGIYRHATTPAGSFPANAFGLHDMHGNVWEWCADLWQPDGDPAFGVVRGGSWHDPPDLCRSAARLRVRRSEGDDWIGLRVAAEMPVP
jgi:formylglycine-generating enzyme required for sulfatase activity